MSNVTNTVSSNSRPVNNPIKGINSIDVGDIKKELRDLSFFKIANIIAIETRVPALFTGAPGSTKTASINGLYEAYGGLIIPVLCSTLTPSDVLGFPYRDADYHFEDEMGNNIKGILKFSPPWWAVKAIEAAASNKYKFVGLFFDELLTATPAVQAGLLRPLNEGWVGDLNISHIVRIAAGNAKGQSAGFNASQALENRFVTYKVNPDNDDWLNDYILDNSYQYIDYVKYDGDFKTVLAQFYNELIKTNAVQLIEGDTVPQGAFASKRSITSLCKMLYFCSKNSIQDGFIEHLVSGTIGSKYVQRVLSFYRTIKPFDFYFNILESTIESFDEFIMLSYKNKDKIDESIRKRLASIYITATKYDQYVSVLVNRDQEISEMLNINKSMVGKIFKDDKDIDEENIKAMINLEKLSFKPITSPFKKK